MTDHDTIPAPDDEAPETVRPESAGKMPTPPKSLEDSYIVEVITTIAEYHQTTKLGFALAQHASEETRALVEQSLKMNCRMADCLSTLKIAIERHHENEEERAARPLAGKSILVVDDARDLADVLAKILACKGARAEAVYSGERAQEVLAKQDFDSALVDVNLDGGISGVDLAEWMRVEHPNVRVALMTGFLFPADEARVRALGLRVFIKPIDTADVLEAAGAPR